MNFLDLCGSKCNIFCAVTEFGVAAVTRYMSLTVYLDCGERLGIVWDVWQVALSCVFGLISKTV